MDKGQQKCLRPLPLLRIEELITVNITVGVKMIQKFGNREREGGKTDLTTKQRIWIDNGDGHQIFLLTLST